MELNSCTKILKWLDSLAAVKCRIKENVNAALG